ncbi:MAG: GNAT family N-acetyltransferase [Candidatus Latescibacteria bacterium]|nr:GNAT family N-acetyltransferase [Candidatus Latescibacterota bacterium]
MKFDFLNPGLLREGDLQLDLVEKRAVSRLRPEYPPSYNFVMRSPGDRRQRGRFSLRLGDSDFIERYAGHIGYSVEQPFRGRRYAARSCRLIVPLARRHGFDYVWLTCNPDNWASRRSCELAGAQYVETVPLPRDTDMYRAGERYKRRYRLDVRAS